ncbi:MAG TPA: hypothetical protein VFX59_28255 [Polyangiales bacterium]|nr:hypothetical protein [Polyangiales bacterium]
MTAACSSDDPAVVDAGEDASWAPDDADNPPGKLTDAGLDARAVLLDAAPDADDTYRLADGAACTALGCDELGYQCGETLDNCGDPLNCNLEGNVTPCPAPERCGGDPDKGQFKCGCKPRANACEAQGAQCGVVDECGNQVDCGDCPDGKLCLAGNTCACTPNSNPCGTRVCGMASDGCGKMVACGANVGACPSGACSVDGQCTCRTKAEACVGQTGAYSENGCSYDCTVGSTCTPDNVAACAGAECGTALNNCGETVPCGALAGACAAGARCIGPQFVLDSVLPAQSATYQGGYCAADGAAKLLGKYAVRVHAFRQAGNAIASFMNRAEAVSLVLVQYVRAAGTVKLTDYGCVATTINDPDGPFASGVRSVVPLYRNLVPAVMNLAISGLTFSRPDIAEATGFTVGVPPYCAGVPAGTLVDLPAADPRRGKPNWWPDNKCACPNPAAASELPGPNNYATATMRDCRLNDADQDGKPGFTAQATAPLGLGGEIWNASVAHGTWSGTIRDDRFHIGWAGDAVVPLTRVVLACPGGSGGVCDDPAIDCGCPEQLSSTVQFVPLPDSAPLDCSIYYSGTAVNQGQIDTTFSTSFGTCNATTPCPQGSVCRTDGKCFPETSRNACTKGVAGACPTGMSCRGDTACWPTAAVCPASSTIVGGYCGK